MSVCHSVTRTDRNMVISWRRRGVSQMWIVAFVILCIVVVALVTEASPSEGRGHERRHGSSGLTVGSGRSPKTSRRQHHRYNRVVHLSDAVNLTLCSYSVYDDVMEGRVPEVIQRVECVENGCRCSVVNNIGTYACTQLLTNMLVTINNEQVRLLSVPYACVCASKLGIGIVPSKFNHERFKI